VLLILLAFLPLDDRQRPDKVTASFSFVGFLLLARDISECLSGDHLIPSTSGLDSFPFLFLLPFFSPISVNQYIRHCSLPGFSIDASS
jgi:hypothetical protein